MKKRVDTVLFEKKLAQSRSKAQAMIMAGQVTVNGKKVAGILLDSSIQSNNIEYIILGIGINFKIKQKKLENMLKKQSNFYGVQTLTKKNERPIILVKEFLCELENILQMINSDQNKKIISMWTKRSS